MLFGYNLFSNLFKIVSVYRNGDKEIKQGVMYIKLPDAKEEVFSFFNWLFLHPNLYENHAIIAHEKTHIRQGHSYDILFFELLRCLNWFNPLVYKLFTTVKLNHEYISDREASTILTNKYEYATLLIQHAYVPREQLSHSAFTQSQLEQRIKQLGKQESKTKAVVKYLMVLPIAGVLFFISAFKVEKSYGFIHVLIDQTPTIRTYPYQQITSAPQQKGKATTPVEATAKIANKGKNEGIGSRTPILTAKGGSTSELISGPGVLDQIAAELATQGKRLYARDYMMHWTINKNNLLIRKVTHGVLSGTVAQLFRGDLADTLYVDQGYYKIKDQVVTISTDNLMIGYANGNQNSNKKLIIIDAFKRKIVHILAHVDIRTFGTVYKVVTNPDYGYVKRESSLSVDTLASNYVDMKTVNANYQYIMASLNSRVREAKITANEIITNETKTPKEDPWQPGIIW
ncbi:BlaR1 peptidase M56 [compost metagenome]